MKRAARIQLKSKFFISPLNISVQMTQQQQRKFQLKSARCLSPVCKCELHSLYRVCFNYSFEVLSVKGDFIHTETYWSQGAPHGRRNQATMCHAARLQGYPVPKPVKFLTCVSDNLSRHKIKERKECFHPVHGFWWLPESCHTALCFGGSFLIFKCFKVLPQRYT